MRYIHQMRNIKRAAEDQTSAALFMFLVFFKFLEVEGDSLIIYLLVFLSVYGYVL